MNIRVEASAKVNIGWRVGPERQDGFHEVNGTIQTIDLCDKLFIQATQVASEESITHKVKARLISLVVGGTEATPELRSTDNLIFRAAELLAGNCEPLDTEIILDKQIPVAAGLGGGSADAAAALVGLASAWGRPNLNLKNLAQQLGSDVPPILTGGFVGVKGRGEVTKSLGTTSGYHFVLGFGNETLLTKDVYNAFKPVPRTDSLHHNDLQAAAEILCPSISKGLKAMQQAGATVTFLCGSGPTVAGIAVSKATATRIAARAASSFRRVIIAKPSPTGIRTFAKN